MTVFRISPARALLAFAWLAGCLQSSGGAGLQGTAEHWFRAELDDVRKITVHDTGADPLPDYVLTDASGRIIGIDRIEPAGPDRFVLSAGSDLDIRAVHYLSKRSSGERTRVRFDGWFRTLHSDKPLGANVGPGGETTTFALFAPRATGVRLHLYDRRDALPDEATGTVDLAMDTDGVWSAALPGNLHGTYYDFTVHGPDGPGNAFYGTRPVHISDPYARVNAGSLGKSRVWQETPSVTPLAGGPVAMADVVAYEVHVQDFTDLLPEGALSPGPFRAMATPGLVNARGEPVGLDHLARLGVNVVHLMPVQEYLHHPDQAWRARFAGDPVMQALGIAEENYQWGYRTTHAFAIENRYGDPRAEPGNEREAFRSLVNALHARGLAVIVDLVPNHTGENMDGRERLIHFNAIDKAYYYRTDDEVRHIGPFGNEVKTEDRPMVRRWLIEQCLALINDFGIDGFRIDLAGQIDQQTLVALREAVGADILIYGEPWIAISDAYIRADPGLSWYKEDAPITFFQDEARDALAGSPFQLSDKARDRGYAGGRSDLRTAVMQAIANAYPDEAASPDRGISYLDIHDNWALADRFATTGWNGLEGVDEARYRIAAGLLMTSAGPVVIHGGAEIMRSKGLAPLEEWNVAAPFGDIHFKGRDDTYNLRAPNRFAWETVGATPGDGAKADYAAMLAWWSGLVKFRLGPDGAAFRRRGPVLGDDIRWFLPEDEALLGYLADERVLVLVNVGDRPGRFRSLGLPAGDWLQLADGTRIDPEAGLGAPVDAARLETVDVPATSLSVWVRR